MIPIDDSSIIFQRGRHTTSQQNCCVSDSRTRFDGMDLPVDTQSPIERDICSLGLLGNLN